MLLNRNINNKYLINIGFTTKSEIIGMIPNLSIQKYLRSTHKFAYTDQTTIRELLKVIILNVEENPQPDLSDIYLWGKFYGLIDGEEHELNLDYLVKNYVLYNAIDETIWLNYTLIGRGGYGGEITTTIRLEMPSGEKGHEKTPHVHIRKGNYRKNDPYSNTVRIDLNDLTVMDDAEKKFKKLFNKNEIGLIKWILFKHKDILIKNYNAMLKGALPEVITVDFTDCSYRSGTAVFS